MNIKQKTSNLVSPFYNKVWHGPKSRFTAKLRQVCDDLPPKRRVTVVTVLLSVFVLTAFCLYGKACYNMGAREAHQLDSKFIDYLMLHNTDPFIDGDKVSQYEAAHGMKNIQLDTVPHEAAR